MDGTFSPSQRRRYWLDESFENVLEQWNSLPSSHRRRRRRAPYFLRIECINDIVMAEMEDWLENASGETLRHCARLRYDGEIIPYIRDQLVRGLLLRFDASRRVEQLMIRYVLDRGGLERRLDSWGIPYSRNDSDLTLIDRLVQREGRERDFETHETDTGTEAENTRRQRPYSLTPPGQPGETGETPAPASEPEPPAPAAAPTPPSTPPSAPSRASSPTPSLAFSVAAPPSSLPPPSPPPAEPADLGPRCIICRFRTNAVFYPCCHQYACFNCADLWMRAHRALHWRYPLIGMNCPACRPQVTEIVRNYTL